MLGPGPRQLLVGGGYVCKCAFASSWYGIYIHHSLWMISQILSNVSLCMSVIDCFQPCMLVWIFLHPDLLSGCSYHLYTLSCFSVVERSAVESSHRGPPLNVYGSHMCWRALLCPRVVWVTVWMRALKAGTSLSSLTCCQWQCQVVDPNLELLQ